MSDKIDIDAMFANDLEKLAGGMPSELKLNAAKVKAAQDDEEPGAEKPDLYAKGKGKGKDGKDTDEKKKKDEKKGKIPPQFLSKAKKKLEKKSSLDERFAGELHQAVGLDVPETEADFQRPDVNVDGQTTDAIDDHYLGWMQGKADEDVVKEAMSAEDIARDILSSGKVREGAKVINKAVRDAALKGAAVTAGVGAVGAAGAHMGRKSTGVSDPRDMGKQAAMTENPENLDLIAKLRQKSEKLFG